MWFFKYPIIISAFIITALFQNSFLSYFIMAGFIPNLLFVLFFILIFSEQSHKYYGGFFTVMMAGFIIGLFAPFYFGTAVASLLLVFIFLKTIFYFLKERKNEYLLLYFIPLFLISFALYNISIYVFMNFPHLQFNLGRNHFIELIYNAVWAILLFSLYLYANNFPKKDRQLALFR